MRSRNRMMRRAYVRYLMDRIMVSLWFVPLMMSLAGILLSLLLFRIDAQIPNDLLENSRLVISGSSTEIRITMLGIAGTILATTGVVFSLLTLPLSTVASQYGSRLLRIFLRDHTTQFVLGTFVGTFCYCFTTALSIPNVESVVATPQISATFGLVLTLVAFASLILLIQHISTMLQAPNIVAAAGAELIDVVGLEISEGSGEIKKLDEEFLGSSFPLRDAYQLQVDNDGYIQFVDPQIILNLAKEENLVIRLVRNPGEFVWFGENVALIWPAEKIDERLANHLSRAFQIGNQRTPTQDVEYAVNQLVEISVRAMSPAINDPFTAMTCLDYLGQGLTLFAQRTEHTSYVYDKEGNLRIVFEPVPFRKLLNSAFDMLRHASCDNARVLLHMLQVLAAIGQKLHSAENRQELLRHIQLVEDESQVGNLIDHDRHMIHLRSEELLQGLFSQPST